MCFYNDDPCQFFTSEVRRARRPRKCGTCTHVIRAGERYIRCAGVYDGDWFSGCECRVCVWNVLRVYRRERKEGCRPDESVWPASYLYEGTMWSMGLRWSTRVADGFEVDTPFEMLCYYPGTRDERWSAVLGGGLHIGAHGVGDATMRRE